MKPKHTGVNSSVKMKREIPIDQGFLELSSSALKTQVYTDGGYDSEANLVNGNSMSSFAAPDGINLDGFDSNVSNAGGQDRTTRDGHLSGTADDKVTDLFHRIDTQGKGTIEASELKKFFEKLLQNRNIDMSKQVIAQAVDALLSRGARGRRVSIDKQEFRDLFEEHSYFRQSFESDETQNSDLSPTVTARNKEGQKRKSKNHSLSRYWNFVSTLWMNAYPYLGWIVLYAILFLVAVLRTISQSANNVEAMDVFGSCFLVARVSARAINFHVALVLLPVARHLSTWARHKSFFRRLLLPLDALQKAHMFLGQCILVFTLIHVGGHACGYYRFVHHESWREVSALFPNRFHEQILRDAHGRTEWILSQRATITGLLMLMYMIPACLTLRSRSKRFNCFWAWHHMFLLALIVLCTHGTSALLGKPQSVYWVIFPLLLYIIPRIYREVKCSSAKVLHASVNGNLLDLRLEKPAHWNHVQKPGMYVFLNVPSISKWEWHPFTISTAPSQEDHVGFHIQAAGDWTKQLVATVASTQETRNVSPLDGQRIRMEGPLGSPSQTYKDYPVVVLIGAGIGVTVSCLVELTNLSQM